MSNLHHTHIVRLYESCYEQVESRLYLVIVMEKCEMDLMKEIENRKRNEYRWTEEEIWYYVRCLVDAFAYMQNLSLAHRDIKPLNIFLDANKAPKVGDLGSSKHVSYVYQHTMTGTPLYLSPLLRQAMLTNQREIQHNVYKSDVYSLGLTLLHMITLEPPVQVMVGNRDMRVNAIQGMMAGIGCSLEMQYLLKCMLEEEEDWRPTFVDVWNWLNPAPRGEPAAGEAGPVQNGPVVIYAQPPEGLEDGWKVRPTVDQNGVETAPFQPFPISPDPSPPPQPTQPVVPNSSVQPSVPPQPTQPSVPSSSVPPSVPPRNSHDKKASTKPQNYHQETKDSLKPKDRTSFCGGNCSCCLF